MKILIPSEPDKNSFFQEIILHSKNEFFYGDLNTNTDGFQFVLIQWIEQLFQWKEPTEEELIELENKITEWKRKKMKILHILHNEKRHYGMTNLFKKLYNLIFESTDVFVHFGDFSLTKYQKIFNNSKHVLINHPLYLNTFLDKRKDKDKAREELNISKNTTVVIIPGTIRNLKERKIVLKYFSSLNIKDKLLIAPKMYFRKTTNKQKGYSYLKKIPYLLSNIDALANKSLKKKNFMIGDKFISNDEMSRLISVSDIVWTPRFDTLNSGIVYLAYTFKKVVLGPNIGNIGGVLNDMNMPTYNIEKPKEIKMAFNKALNLAKVNVNPYNDEELKKYNPSEIAKKWDDLLLKLK